ncbi:MAG: type II toxin-antitoxin system RelE/ParE family toxin [Clostridia bacterium]|nr:type II toxin-antitoxin system RelE/ParE family toxin [Clostridia bacterium]
MKIMYSKEAVKRIKKLDKPTKSRIKEAIEKLPDGDVKKLQGYKKDYRLRVGDLRVLFLMYDDIITVKDILPRGQAYKRV